MFKLLVCVVILIKYGECARILMISPTPSYSHQITFHPIMKELALRGHEMVVLTTDPLNDSTLPNLREIDLSFSYTIWNANLKKIAENNGFLSAIFTMMGGMYDILDQQLQHPEVNALIQNNTEHFDLVMIEFMFPTMFAFQKRFDCPFIGISSMQLPGFSYEFMGNPTHSVAYPEAFFPPPGEMNVLHRMAAMLVVPLFEFVMFNYFYCRDLALIEKYFGFNSLSVHDLGASVDMVFVNANPSFNHIRPLNPATVIISGGIHIKDPKPLPPELEAFFNASKSGVIYFSLGSNVKSKDIPDQIKNAITETLAELPYDILWKYEDDNIPNKPKNVKIIKWAPQQDILRHPKIKLFITQGGMQSLEEAMFNHIPLVCVPFYGDQLVNAKTVKNQGMGLVIDDYTKITKQEFKDKILEVVENPISIAQNCYQYYFNVNVCFRYRNRMKELGKLMKDEPMTALEKAVWWTEYVLRHKGAKHLKSKTVPFYQFYYLDVFAVLFAIFACIYVILKKICLPCVCKRKEKVE